MNYRHVFHAGNHADVLKHVVLVRIVELLKHKEKPFRVLDLHAGTGLYALNSEEAAKTGEWQVGVGRLFNSDMTQVEQPPAVESLLAPWRQVVAAVNPEGRLAHYPGSPEILRRLLRPVDRLNLNELHPADSAALVRRYAHNRQIALTALDAAVAIMAQLPPPERRGLVIIDPPYEKTDEVQRIVAMLADGFSRFATGVYCVWYPVTGDGLDERLANALTQMQRAPILRAEITVREVRYEGKLAGSGVLVLNPPWQLENELSVVLPALRATLGQTDKASVRLETLLP